MTVFRYSMVSKCNVNVWTLNPVEAIHEWLFHLLLFLNERFPSLAWVRIGWDVTLGKKPWTQCRPKKCLEIRSYLASNQLQSNVIHIQCSVKRNRRSLAWKASEFVLLILAEEILLICFVSRKKNLWTFRCDCKTGPHRSSPTLQKMNFSQQCSSCIFHLKQ